MKHFLRGLLFVCVSFFAINTTTALEKSNALTQNAGTSSVAIAASKHAQKVHVEGTGVVQKVLPDDNEGDHHQKFLVRTPEGIKLLFAHNIDIAQRVEKIKQGDTISFAGEYIWNDKGGVVHWTHHDPSGRHVAGWIKLNGVTYQ